MAGKPDAVLLDRRDVLRVLGIATVAATLPRRPAPKCPAAFSSSGSQGKLPLTAARWIAELGGATHTS